MSIVQAPVLQVLDTKHNSLTEILEVLAQDGGVIVLNMLSLRLWPICSASLLHKARRHR